MDTQEQDIRTPLSTAVEFAWANPPFPGETVKDWVTRISLQKPN